MMLYASQMKHCTTQTYNI